jgi:hypothetical protein
LFLVGVVSARVEADDDVFVLHPRLLEIVSSTHTNAGLLSLVIQANEGGPLVVRAEGQQLTLDADEPNKAISAVHQLLHNAGIFIPSEKAGL